MLIIVLGAAYTGKTAFIYRHMPNIIPGIIDVIYSGREYTTQELLDVINDPTTSYDKIVVETTTLPSMQIINLADYIFITNSPFYRMAINAIGVNGAPDLNQGEVAVWKQGAATIGVVSIE